MAKSQKFGTFAGVFTPSILTILGVIMYLRLPMIVGEAGLFATLGIIAIAHIISFTTGLSVSSIATDKRVEAGGTYFMISRSLGLPIGGTLGLALFVGLSFSVSLYLIGFSESFLTYWGFEADKNNIRIAGSVTLLAVTILTFISTSLALKTQFFIMAAIVLSLASIFLGTHEFRPEAPLLNATGSKSLMVLFGIFFPAVTGFEAGVSMSGDLKDPKKSIPRGSISAIAVGFVAYVGLTFYFAYTVSPEALAGDSEVLLKISWIPELVIAGIWGATLSSALGSILGAPRILQATAADRITPRIFAKGYGSGNEPRNALLLTFVIAEAGILIGDLNMIARVVSIFFITTYGFLNLSCAFESWASADFRPEFKTPVWISLLGSIACFIVMLELDILAMIGASVILITLYLFLKRKELSLAGGDAWSGVWASLVKSGLERLNQTREHSRNWRPNVIMFHGETREHLVELGRAITGRLGMLSGFELIESNVSLLTKPKSDQSVSADSENYFVHKFYCRNIFTGMDEIARVYGFAGVQPNTILMGWSMNEKHKDKFIPLIKSFEKSDYNTLYLHYDRQKGFGSYETIDVWWSGWGRNLSFAINLLKHILYNSKWKNVNIRLMAVVNQTDAVETARRTLNRIVAHHRMPMTIKIVNNSIDRLPYAEIVRKESKDADLTIVGLKENPAQNMEQAVEAANELAPQLNSTLLINASADFESYELELTKTEEAPGAPASEETQAPELKLSRYAAIAEDVQKHDTTGRKTLDTFFEKTFAPFFVEIFKQDEAFGDLISSTFANLQRAFDYKDEYRRRRAILKIENDFYYHVRKLLDEVKKQRIETQRQALEEGVRWYAEALSAYTLKIPQRLKLYYDKEDFRIARNDSAEIKAVKLRKKIFQPFAKHTISGSINYREVARYYLEDNRHVFLSTVLNDVYHSYQRYLTELKSSIEAVDAVFENLEHGSASPDIAAAEKSVRVQADAAAASQKQLRRELLQRIAIDFRKNIQLLNNDLEKININRLIRRKRRSARRYKSVKDSNLHFATRWHKTAGLLLNRLYLDATLTNIEARLKDELSDLKLELISQVDQKALKTIARVRNQAKDAFEKNGRQDMEIDDELSLPQLFGERRKEFIRIIDELPQETAIAAGESGSADEEEIVELPVNRMAAHFMESRFLGPVQDYLEKMNERFKSAILSIQDQLRLSRFHFDNIDPDLAHKEAAVAEIIKELDAELTTEEKRVEEMRRQTLQTIDQKFEEAFLPVSSAAMLTESATEFSQFLRNYQSKKMMTRVGAASRRMNEVFRDQLARLVYSRSEGVLLARKITEEDRFTAPGSRTLDLVERVSPREVVLNKLPNYYKNLFSGRSTIGRDFWVERPEEEKQLQKAVERRRKGISGAVMILGDRNAGKTVFCRHALLPHFKPEHILHVFPPKAGSTAKDVFEQELQRAAGMSGSASEILMFHRQSAVVVHDLEMWWERSEEGGTAVSFILELISRHDCFFVLNMHPASYELMDQLYDIGERLLDIIHLRPFDSQDLRNLIMVRHYSSGLQFLWGKKQEESLSEFQLARLFNRYFNCTNGNPGFALKTWLANIEKAGEKTIYIKTPEAPDASALNELDADWMTILAQFVLHKRMNMEKLARTLQMQDGELSKSMNQLKKVGLVEERSANLLLVNSYIEPLLTDFLKERGLI